MFQLVEISFYKIYIIVETWLTSYRVLTSSYDSSEPACFFFHQGISSDGASISGAM